MEENFENKKFEHTGAEFLKRERDIKSTAIPDQLAYDSKRKGEIFNIINNKVAMIYARPSDEFTTSFRVYIGTIPTSENIGKKDAEQYKDFIKRIAANNCFKVIDAVDKDDNSCLVFYPTKEQ